MKAQPFALSPWAHTPEDRRIWLRLCTDWNLRKGYCKALHHCIEKAAQIADRKDADMMLMSVRLKASPIIRKSKGHTGSLVRDCLWFLHTAGSDRPPVWRDSAEWFS